MSPKQLPRLLYVGDVGVESTAAGYAQLYRLLESYPPTLLHIVEGNLWSSVPERRLPNVTYETFDVGHERLMRSRLTPLYTLFLQATASRRARRLFQIVRDFKPEAVLTLAHGFSWMTAAALAEYFKLPLHLIVYDDWPRLAPVPERWRGWLDESFANVYRSARSRFCISPYMAESFKERYGARGTVLYPLRPKDHFVFEEPPRRRHSCEASPVFAYFGSIHGDGYARPLVSLAMALEKMNGRLIIYGDHNEEGARQLGLKRANVDLRQHEPVSRLTRILRDEADALFVSMSFVAGHRHNMELCFPSKLTDYTAIGLPLLICAPSYSSAVRWARENPGVAEVVEKVDEALLTEAIRRLVEKPEHRSRLAIEALAKGHEYFSHALITAQFQQVIAST